MIGYCIDCFKCVSYNGANKACDDPFHNNYSTAILESPCMGGRKGRDGLFPATACIKIAGYYGEWWDQIWYNEITMWYWLSWFQFATDDTGETITVRGCALDSGTLTTDTEIIRMSHCGKFYYDNRCATGLTWNEITYITNTNLIDITSDITFNALIELLNILTVYPFYSSYVLLITVCYPMPSLAIIIKYY